MMFDSCSRRSFLASVAAGLVGASSSTISIAKSQTPELVWHDARDWGVEGKGWSETIGDYDRLPARAEAVVPAGVWRQSRHSAGMLVRFRSNASELWTDHTVGLPALSSPDLAAIGYSGLDLYAENEKQEWKWLSVTRPRQQVMKGPLVTGLIEGERAYTLYLPLYNQTESLKIGVPRGASFDPILPRREKPLLFYGTSITQGASASRPGMSHVAILGRRLNVPILNLGFGGAGKMERAVGELLVEQDPLLYVIDCLPNMNAKEVSQRAVPLVQQIRSARPETPIILVEDRTYPNSAFLPARMQNQTENRKALQAALKELMSSGVKDLWYIHGDALLGEDHEATSDGSHPTDLGFMRQADVFEHVIKKALSGHNQGS